MYVVHLAVMSCITVTFMSDGARNMPYSTADHTNLQRDTPCRSMADYQPPYMYTVPGQSQLVLVFTEKLINLIITLYRNDTLLIQSGARKTGPPSRRTTWAKVSDSVQEIKQMQMQSTYWLEKVLK